jgi:hypothetical protein
MDIVSNFLIDYPTFVPNLSSLLKNACQHLKVVNAHRVEYETSLSLEHLVHQPILGFAVAKVDHNATNGIL